MWFLGLLFSLAVGSSIAVWYYKSKSESLKYLINEEGRRQNRNPSSEELKSLEKMTIRIGALIFLVCFSLIIIFQSFQFVQTQTVKVVKRFGKVKERPLLPGLRFVVPFIETTETFITRTKTYITTTEKGTKADYHDGLIQSLTRDGQKVWLGVTVKYHPDPLKTPWIYERVGLEDQIVENVVRAHTRGIGRRVPNKYSARNLYTDSSYICQDDIFDELKPKFEDSYIILDEFVLRTVQFDEDYLNAIEKKQIELENIITEKNKAEQELWKKQQKIVAAQGDSAAIAIKTLALKKDPIMIQYEFVQKLSPNLQYMVLPNDMIPMIDLKNLRK